MRANPYDDEAFFGKYADLPRSRLGLEAAGEWEALRLALPDFKGKRVLDLGCGYGWHGAYAAEHGAASVLGVDRSRKMIRTAEEKNTHPNVEFAVEAIEDIDFPADSFDVVLSSLALHYVASFEAVARNVAACLTPGGNFVFSVEHPIFTAHGPQEWFRDAHGGAHVWPVDRYFEEGPRETLFLGQSVEKYHKTLGTYFDGLRRAGFALDALVEPRPPERMLDANPELRDELRRPMMLILAASKP